MNESSTPNQQSNVSQNTVGNHKAYKGFVAGVFSGIAKLTGILAQLHSPQTYPPADSQPQSATRKQVPEASSNTITIKLRSHTQASTPSKSDYRRQTKRGFEDLWTACCRRCARRALAGCTRAQRRRWWDGCLWTRCTGLSYPFSGGCLLKLCSYEARSMLGSLTLYRRLLHENVFTPSHAWIFMPGQLAPSATVATTAAPATVANGHASDVNNTRRLPALGHAIAGTLAGWTVSFVAAPVEHVKARLQIQYAAGKNGRLYSGPVHCVASIVSVSSLLTQASPL